MINGIRTNHTHKVSFVNKVLQSVKYSATSRRYPSMNSTLINGLTSYTSMSIDIQMTNRFCIGISDPRHFTFSSSHIGSRYVHTGSYDNRQFYRCILPLKKRSLLFSIFYFFSYQPISFRNILIHTDKYHYYFIRKHTKD